MKGLINDMVKNYFVSYFYGSNYQFCFIGARFNYEYGSYVGNIMLWLKLFLVIVITLVISGAVGYLFGKAFEDSETSVALAAVVGILIGQSTASLISYWGRK